jgi:transposase
VQAPAPAQAIDGGMVTEALLAYVAVMKYAYHMPLYRLAQMLGPQGISLDRGIESGVSPDLIIVAWRRPGT